MVEEKPVKSGDNKIKTLQTEQSLINIDTEEDKNNKEW